ncbi:MAG TPA: metalloregulator ArsR/SmtB family transcription factor [Streptosporangiaceae bacterium]
MVTYEDAGLGLLGDPTRRAIFELLARGPCSVGELAKQLPISRPAVSQHLRMLKDGGLVSCRSEGTRNIYRLDPGGLRALRAYLDRASRGAAAAATASDGEPEGGLG